MPLSNMPEKLYVVTRKDLTPGYQACQSAHAAFIFAVKYPKLTRQWHEESNYLILLSVDNQIELLKLLVLAMSKGLKTAAFYESDLNGECTAIALEPGSKARDLCSNLDLTLKNWGDFNEV